MCAVLILTIASMNAEPVPPKPFTADRFREHVAFLASDERGGRDVGAIGSQQAFDYLKRHLADCGCKGAGRNGGWEQSFEHRRSADAQVQSKKPLAARNLLGLFPGKGALANQLILVSTHHDHLGIHAELARNGQDGIFNGADDNASGCAALLLVAEALFADRTALPDSHRSVLFVSFDAEERGLIGSRHYVENPAWPLERTAANLNLDMIGRLERKTVFAIDARSSEFLTTRVVSLAEGCGLVCQTHIAGTRRSDHMNFLDREIPALHFCTGMHADYHQVTDETARVNHAGGARIAWLTYRLVRETIETAQPIRYRRPDPTLDATSLIRLVYLLGLVPVPDNQLGKYPKIAFVVPGSLAAMQGMRSGDEIVAIGGRSFERVEEAALLFGQLRFDRDVELTVLRNGAKLPIRFPAAGLKAFSGPAVQSVAAGRFEVTFHFRPESKSKSVALAGSFNGWNTTSHPMIGPDKDGAYVKSVVLAAGEYEYKFVLDGKQWIADPTNVYVVGPFGNSFLRIETGKL